MSIKIYEQLKIIREEQGLTQLQLSKLCGIKPQNISRYERGESNLTLSNLEKILKALKHKIILKKIVP